MNSEMTLYMDDEIQISIQCEKDISALWHVIVELEICRFAFGYRIKPRKFEFNIKIN